MSYTPPPPPGPGPDDQSGAPQGPYGQGQGGYGPGMPPGGQPPGGGYGGPAPGNNVKAVVALVLGIVGVIFSFCCALIGLVLGIVALVLGTRAGREIAASNGYQSGAGMAKAGRILGIIDIVLAAAFFVLGIVLNGSDGFGFNTSP